MVLQARTVKSFLLQMTEEKEKENKNAESGSLPPAESLRQTRAQRPQMRIGLSWFSSSEGSGKGSGCSGATRKLYPVLHRTARRLGGSPDARWQPPRRIGGCFWRGGVGGGRSRCRGGEEGRAWPGGVCAVPADRSVSGQLLLLLLPLLTPNFPSSAR